MTTGLGMKTRPGGTFDAELEFKDAGLVAASAAAQVDGSDKIVNVGTGALLAELIIDVSALEIDADEIYDIVVQGSTDADFGTDTNICDLVSISLGIAATKRTDSNKSDAVGRYKLYFDNENNGTYYPYLRVYTVVAGTIATGINYTAWATKVV